MHVYFTYIPAGLQFGTKECTNKQQKLTLNI